MLFDFAPVMVFTILGVAFIYGNLIIASFIRPADYQQNKMDVYECGEPTIGSSWVRYNIRFYTIALVYLIFDVEVVFLFPVALLVKDLGLLALFEVLFFIVVLAVGLAYAWRFGNLDWVRGGQPADEVKPETSEPAEAA